MKALASAEAMRRLRVLSAYLAYGARKMRPNASLARTKVASLIKNAGRHTAIVSVVVLTLVLGIAFGFKMAHVSNALSLGLDPTNYLVTMNGLFGGDRGAGRAQPQKPSFPDRSFQATGPR